MSRKDDGTMTFWEHLDELRSRLLRAAIAVVAGSIAAWLYRETLLDWLTRPFLQGWKMGGVSGTASLHFASPAALFVSYVKLALMGGLVIALPIVFYQLWMFVAPGLYSREKRFALPFVLISCMLFATGGYFSWRVVMPNAYQYLLGFSGDVGSAGFSVQPTVMIGDYIDFVLRMLLAFGAAFELPVLIFFLTIAGVIDHRHLIKFARYFVIVAFIVAAVITPPDVVSQFFLAIPLCILYAISIGIAFIFSRRREPKSAPAAKDSR